MYTKEEFDQQVKTLYDYHKEPIHKLIKRTGLTRPTVMKFLQGNALRSYNQDKLIEEVIKLNEEAQEKRRSLQERGKRIQKLELELAEGDAIGKSESV